MTAKPKAPVRILDGAWFVADAHYAWYNPDLYDFFAALRPADLPPQLFLMGDIFDLLFGHAPNSIEPNRKMVDVLVRMSRSCEVIYLEGNHDFGLGPIFKEAVRIVPRGAQPLLAEAGGKRIALHHGDVLQGAGYEIYTALIRNPLVDRALNGVDTLKKGAIIAWLEAYNRRKKPCYKIVDFEEKVAERMKRMKARYDFDLWIEGHFHQDIALSVEGVEYVNLPAFACDGSLVKAGIENGRIRFEKIKTKKVENVEQ